MSTHYINVADFVKSSIHLNTRPRAALRALYVAELLNEGRLDSVIKAAFVAGVGRPTMYAACVLVRSGDSKLIAAVLDGTVALQRAAAVARARAKRTARLAQRAPLAARGILAGEVRA